MKTYKRIKAVRTAIDIIKFLSDQREPASAADAAAALEMQYGTLMCQLVTLEDAGLVRRIGDRWELGTGMALLWSRQKAKAEAIRDQANNLLAALGV